MCRSEISWGLAWVMGAAVPSAWADSPVQPGPSGKTYASLAVLCLSDPGTGAVQAAVDVGLRQPAPRAQAVVSLNGQPVARLSAARPAVPVWLPEGMNDVGVRLNRRIVDRFAFGVSATQCQMPDTSGNTISADGSLETSASGRSSATVAPGCAHNPATGEVQPFVNLFAEGQVILNVSVNGVPLTQLSPQRPSTPVFLQAGWNQVSATSGSAAVDQYVRNVGDGRCMLPP